MKKNLKTLFSMIYIVLPHLTSLFHFQHTLSTTGIMKYHVHFKGQIRKYMRDG